MVKTLANWGFVLGLFGSIVVGMSQMSFFGVWAMLELNMLMFLVILSSNKETLYSSPMKYFMMQSVGSSVLLLGLSLTSMISMPEIIKSLVSLGLFMKLGMAPLHGWFISFLSGVDWSSFFITVSLQKVLPLYLINQVHSELVIIVVLISAWVGVTGSLNQISLKKLMGYSSIFSGAWVVHSNVEFEVSMFYLMVYSLSLSPILLLAVNGELLTLSGSLNLSHSSGFLIMFSSLLNLGGMPPFIGFYAKVAVIESLMLSFQVSALLALMLGSMLLLYVYLGVLFKSALAYANCPSSTSFHSMGISGIMVILLTMGAILVPFGLRDGVQHKKIWTFSN